MFDYSCVGVGGSRREPLSCTVTDHLLLFTSHLHFLQCFFSLSVIGFFFLFLFTVHVVVVRVSRGITRTVRSCQMETKRSLNTSLITLYRGRSACPKFWQHKRFLKSNLYLLKMLTRNSTSPLIFGVKVKLLYPVLTLTPSLLAAVSSLTP